MNKKSLEIIVALSSVGLFIVLIAAATLMKPFAGFGYMVALLFFIVIMGFAGVKLAEMPEK